MTSIGIALLDAPPQATDAYAAAAARLRGVRLAASRDESHDAVVVFPADGDGKNAFEAARAGKHVLVDSVADLGADRIELLAAACRAAGVRLMIGQRLRFDPSIAAVKGALDKGQLGTPALLRTHAWGARKEGAGSGAGSGVERLLLERLDVACWIFGGPPTDVFALGNGAAGSAGWPEFVQVHLGFSLGGMALISATTSLPVGDDYRTLSVIGTTGAAYADDRHQMQLAFQGGRARAIATGTGVAATTGQLREFVDSIAAGREPIMTAADAMRARGVLESARRSLSAGATRHAGGTDAGES